MMQDPFQYYRRSLKLRKYNYSQGSMHFITICTHNRECLLGEVTDGEMQLNEHGKIVRAEWLHTEVARPNVLVDEFVIMPNHLHGILALTGGLKGEKRRGSTTRYDSTIGPPPAAVPDSIAAIMAHFISNVTRRINAMRGTPGAPVWQPDYYEHVIRNEHTLERLREHIAGNPTTWDKDENNPTAQKPSKD